MIKRLFSLQNFIFFALLFVFVLLVISPAVYAKECLLGFTMWVQFVLPALFPFFFLTKILTAFSLVGRFTDFLSPIVRKVFKAPPVTSYIMLMSFISGYPIGAKLIADFQSQGLLSTEDASHISILCSTSGIPFVLGSVGGLMLKSGSVAAVIYLSQILASLIVGFIMCRKIKQTKGSNGGSTNSNDTPLPLKTSQIDSVLSDSIHSSVMSILYVGGYVSLFYVLLKVVSVSRLLFPLEFLLNNLFIQLQFGENVGTALIRGIFEVTTGCKSLSNMSNLVVAGGFITAIVGFGGLSINMQSLTFLTTAKVKPLRFLGWKAVQGFVAVAIYCGIAVLFL